LGRWDGKLAAILEIHVDALSLSHLFAWRERHDKMALSRKRVPSTVSTV